MKDAEPSPAEEELQPDVTTSSLQSAASNGMQNGTAATRDEPSQSWANKGGRSVEDLQANFSALRMTRSETSRKSIQVRSNFNDSMRSYLAEVRLTRALPVLEPHGSFMFFWNPTMFLLTIYAVVALPVDIAFSWWEPSVAYKVWNIIADCVFILDMAIICNTGIVQDDMVIYQRKDIARHYAATWLPIDIASNFPLDWFLGRSGQHRKLVKFLKMPKILRFVRLLRSLKDQVHFIGPAAVFLGMILFAHYGCCIWVFSILDPSCQDGINFNACPNPAGTYAEGLSVAIAALSGSDAWTRFIYGAGSGSRIAKFRKMAPLNGWEEMFSCYISLFGYILLACLFGTVNHAMSYMNQRGQNRFCKLKERQLDMKASQIPFELQMRVQATYEHAWMFGDWHDGFLTDDMLSIDLRRNLAFHIYGPALLAVPMFSKIAENHSNDLKCISQKITCKVFTPGDLIIQCGERAHELFLVFAGVAQPVDKQGNNMRVLLKRGDFFGEICFLFPGRRRTASVVCVEFCRLMVLTLNVFEELGLEHLLHTIRENCATKMDMYELNDTACELPAHMSRLSANHVVLPGETLARLQHAFETEKRISVAHHRLLSNYSLNPVSENRPFNEQEPDVTDPYSSVESPHVSAELVDVDVPAAAPSGFQPQGAASIGPATSLAMSNSSSSKLDRTAPSFDEPLEIDDRPTTSASNPTLSRSPTWGERKKMKVAKPSKSAEDTLQQSASSRSLGGEVTAPKPASKAGALRLAPKAPDAQLGLAIKALAELHEASERNTAEILARLQEVEMKQAQLVEITAKLSKSQPDLSLSSIVTGKKVSDKIASGWSSRYKATKAARVVTQTE